MFKVIEIYFREGMVVTKTKNVVEGGKISLLIYFLKFFKF